MSSAAFPPRWAEQLLDRALVSPAQKHGIGGDLREDYRRVHAARGRLRADLWYWREAVLLYFRFRLERRHRRAAAPAPPSRGSGEPGRQGGGSGPKALQDVAQDIRLAFRGLMRAPAFTGIALLSLALGIGANTGLFSVIQAVWFTPVPGVSEPEKITEILVTERLRPSQEWTYPDFLAVRESEVPLEAVAGWKDRAGAITTAGGSRGVTITYASAELFRVLGIEPAMGRSFLPSEEEDNVVVVSHDLWENELEGVPDILGTSISVNQTPYTVVGVTPNGFRGHRTLGPPTDLWIPLRHHPFISGEASLAENREIRWLQVLGRLEAGTELEEADAALSTVFSRLAEEFPETNEDRRARAYSFGPVPALGRDASLMGVIGLLVMAGVVLLIICGNVAGMILARNATRDQEFAVRLALGSGPGRLVRFWMVEALLLGGMGGGLGIVLALSGSESFGVMAGTPLPPGAMEVNLPVLLFSVGLTLCATITFGLLPALRFSNPELASSIKEDSRGGGRRVGKVHWIAASAQTGVAFVFLAVSLLFVRALGAWGQQDPGFEPDGLLVASVDLSFSGYNSTDQGEAFFEEVKEALGALPGVAGVTIADGMPLDQVGNYTSVSRADGAESDHSNVQVEFTRAAEAFFETIGTPILQGRGFEESDDETSERVAVITRSLADRLWPGEVPLGRRVRVPVSLGPAEIFTVVGVSANTASSRARENHPHVFLPLRQTYRPRVMVIVRALADPGGLAAPVRAAILETNPSLPYPELSLGRTMVARALAAQRSTASMAGVLGAVALLLSAIGVYGVISFGVASRTREIGLRMAVGASRSRILKEILGGAAWIALPGLVGGGLLAVATAFSMKRFLLGISPADPLSLTLAAGVLLMVVLSASLVPAWRASATEPMGALRRE